MQYKWLAIIFLLSFFPISAMELTTTNHSSGICITDDLFITSVCPRLDRPARDTLRCTCTKYLKIVHSQDELNKNYKEAFFAKNDMHQMFYWKSMGALEQHQEFAYAVKNKKDKLALWLLERNTVAVWNAYCLNIREAVETSTVDEMVPVIKWLLDTRKPVTCNGEYLSGYHYANNLKEQYPEVQKFIDLFKAYEQEEKERKKVEMAERILSFGGRSWHARSEYY